MGFFSWKTQDTGKSIANVHSGREPLRVRMTGLINGERVVYIETAYDGYGIFGGKDYFELWAQTNGLSDFSEDKPQAEWSPESVREHEPARTAAIELSNSDTPGLLYPALTEGPVPDDHDFTKESPNCPYQGYFFDDVCEDIGFDNIGDLKQGLMDLQ